MIYRRDADLTRGRVSDAGDALVFAKISIQNGTGGRSGHGGTVADGFRDRLHGKPLLGVNGNRITENIQVAGAPPIKWIL